MTKPSQTDRRLSLIGEHAHGTFEAELAGFRELALGDQETVLGRLEALYEYSRLATPTYRDAEAAAARIGMKRTNFLRLLARWREFGPVAGLTPGRRVRQRPSTARSGFAGPVEEELRQLMAEKPHERLLWYAGELEEALKKKPDVAVPTLSALRRRVNALRAGTDASGRTAIVHGRDARFDRGVLVDYTALDVEVLDRIGEGSWRRGPLVAAFVVDVETRLITGAGVGRPGRLDDAVMGAIADRERFSREPTIGSVPIQSQPDSIVWAHPPELADTAARAAEVGLLNGVDVDVRLGEPSRAGVELLRLLGDQIGALTIKPRLTSIGAKVSETRGTVTGYVDRLTAARMLADAVDDWNYAVLCRREGRRADATPELRAQRLREWTLPEGWVMSGERLAGFVGLRISSLEAVDRFACHAHGSQREHLRKTREQVRPEPGSKVVVPIDRFRNRDLEVDVLDEDGLAPTGSPPGAVA